MKPIATTTGCGSSCLIKLLLLMGLCGTSCTENGTQRNQSVKPQKQPEAKAESAPDNERSLWNDVHMEVELPLILDKPGSVLAIVTMKNKSSRAVSFTEMGYHETLDIAVYDSEGIRAGLTKFGNRKLNGDTDLGRVMIDSSLNAVIGPGQSKEFRVPISEYFLLEPGAYVLQVSLDIRMDGIHGPQHRLCAPPTRFQTTAVSPNTEIEIQPPVRPSPNPLPEGEG